MKKQVIPSFLRRVYIGMCGHCSSIVSITYGPARVYMNLYIFLCESNKKQYQYQSHSHEVFTGVDWCSYVYVSVVCDKLHPLVLSMSFIALTYPISKFSNQAGFFFRGNKGHVSDRQRISFVFICDSTSIAFLNPGTFQNLILKADPLRCPGMSCGSICPGGIPVVRPLSALTSFSDCCF